MRKMFKSILKDFEYFRLIDLQQYHKIKNSTIIWNNWGWGTIFDIVVFKLPVPQFRCDKEGKERCLLAIDKILQYLIDDLGFRVVNMHYLNEWIDDVWNNDTDNLSLVINRGNYKVIRLTKLRSIIYGLSYDVERQWRKKCLFSEDEVTEFSLIYRFTAETEILKTLNKSFLYKLNRRFIKSKLIKANSFRRHLI